MQIDIFYLYQPLINISSSRNYYEFESLKFIVQRYSPPHIEPNTKEPFFCDYERKHFCSCLFHLFVKVL